MKKFAGAGFILLYVSLLLKPFIPYIGYQINKAYIMQTLCVNRDKPQLHCDGKCYLDKQLQKANDLNTSPEQVPAPKIDLDKLPVALMDYRAMSLPVPEKILQNYSNRHVFFYEFLSEIPTPPPKAHML